MKSVLLAVAFVALMASTAGAVKLVDANTGNWTVGDCLMVQFAMGFTIYPNVTNTNATEEILVSRDAVVDDKQHYCGNSTQDLNLRWFDVAKNDTSDNLERNLTITFGMVNQTYYGVRRLYGTFQLAHFMRKDLNTNKTNKVYSFATVDTGDIPSLVFQVPMKRAYLCADLGPWKVNSSLHYSFDSKPQGTVLRNADISTKKVEFDAFRDSTSPPSVFRSPMDCDYQPNDIVPIVVGCALAGVVIFVLVAYMVGRRRHRQRGYQSV